MRKFIPYFILAGLSFIFFWKFFLLGLLPIPSDTIVGLYHPYRDYYRETYPRGIPFKNFLITDPVRQQYPWRNLSIDLLKEKQVPRWNPYTHAGTPLAGNIQSAPYYPLNILLFLLPFTTGWAFLVILQPLLAGIFMYLFLGTYSKSLLPRLFGALSFSFSGVFLSWMTWNTLDHTFLWVPLILFSKDKLIGILSEPLVKKKLVVYMALLVFSETSMLLAGHAQVAAYGVALTTLYLVARILQKKKIVVKAIVLFSSTALITGCIVFPQLRESFQFIQVSNRASDQQDWQKEGWFIPYRHLAQFVAPDFFGNPATLNYWGTWNYGEFNGYIGLSALIFSLFAAIAIRRKAVYFWLVVLGGAFVMATKNPLSEMPFILSVPLLSTSQPTRLLFIISFVLSIFSAIGFDYFLKQKQERKKLCYPIGIIAVLIALLWAASMKLGDNTVVAQRNLMLPSLVFAATMFLAVGFMLFRKTKHVTFASQIFSVLVVALLVFDLFRLGWKFTPFVQANYLYPTTQTIQFLKQDHSLYRVLSLDDRMFPPNFSVIHRIQAIEGYDPLYLKNYAEFMGAVVRNKPDSSPFPFNRIITLHDPTSKFVDLLNVKYILSLAPLSDPRLQLVFEEGQTKVYENSHVFPRAYFVSSVRTAPSKQEVLSELFNPALDLRNTAVMIDSVPVSNVPLAPDERVLIDSYHETAVEMTTYSQHSRLLVFSDVYYPGWSATIDGAITRIFEVNYAFRGILVPEGNHRITFTY